MKGSAGLPRRKPKRSKAGRRPRLARLCFSLLAGAALAVSALWVSCPYPAERLDGYPAGLRVADAEGRCIRVYASSLGEFRFPVPLEEMSPWIAKATVAVEDRRFYSHPGVDCLAVARAAWQNLLRLRVHSGASTIPQQLARILDPRPRTLFSKAIEAFRALQLEGQRTKDRLLEAYLNLAPYGGNLRGVEAASLRYFGKSARDLSLGEAALLAGLPQSPSRLRPDRYLERALSRRRVVLDAMSREGFITAGQREAAAAETTDTKLHAWPFEAPHLADMARASAASSRAHRVLTTLDRRLQAIAERRLEGFFAADPAGRRRLGGAVVVIEAATRAVRALVGSPDYLDPQRRGAVNGAVRPRSPGSALKPFTYALAFSKGLATPETRLFDAPASYASFAPENFERAYLGPVPAAEALSLSLNVPAVRLQERLGTRALLETLRRLGLHTLARPPASYGLTLTLGGGEVTLLDLTNAYASLLRLGTHRPWRLTEEEPQGQPAESEEGRAGDEGRLLLAGACKLVLDALSSEEHLRRALPGVVAGSAPAMGYKTGTSFGLRDAWAVAFTARHAVGVWIGDPGGRPHPDLVGLKAAAPVALGIAAELAGGSPGGTGPLVPPGDAGIVARRAVCSRTGLPVGEHCPRSVLGRFPVGAPSPPPCSVHREVLVDAASGLEVCSACRGARAVAARVIESWPTEAGLGALARTSLEAAPAHDPACRAVAHDGRPRILSPAEGSEYRVRGSGPLDQRLLLSAAASGSARLLHWFVNGALVASAPPSEPVPWPLARGSHRIRCVDDRGRGAVVRIRVK